MELQEQGFEVGVDTLRNILFDELGLSRRVAFKDEAIRHCPDRDEQFRHIAELWTGFERQGLPVVSIDTKKKEILGNFHRPGQAITDGRLRVHDHDFVKAEQRLVPYGVYDVQRNEGLMYLATGSDTSRLACDAIRRWWRRMGQPHYRLASKMLVLCDCGGSNGNRHHVFKEQLCYLARDLQMDLQVAHYPPGCSKYNPIEHRMFCHVSRSLNAVILKTIEVARQFIARASTVFGLRVVAEIAGRTYQKGIKASTQYFATLPIQHATILPYLNYTAPMITTL